jgi:peroxiredoxin
MALAVTAWARPAAGESGRPWLGVAIADDADAVRVTQVVLDAPADRAGLRTGDLVLAIDEVATPTAEALIEAVGEREVGQEVVVHVVRADRKLALRALLEARAETDAERRALVRDQLIDRRAPELSLRLARGKAVTELARLRGHVVVLEFFATFCEVCPSVHAELAALARHEGPRGLVVRGISGDDPSALARDLETTRVEFPVLHDAGKLVQAEYLTQWYPTVVVIDRRGVVRDVGFGDGPELRRAVITARMLARDELER